MTPRDALIPPAGHDHYRARFWNDLPAVIAHLSRLATGNAQLWWMDHFKATWATPARKRALVIGCGTGWVERELFDRGIALAFDAFDVSADYLTTAEGLRGTRPITYFRADFQAFEPRAQYDLVVNVGSLHHVRHLNALCVKLAQCLTPQGVLVSWDYTGPSRNQYSRRHLELMRAANQALPAHLRTAVPLRPRLHEVIHADPTEAVHSSEILTTVQRSFRLLEHRPLGGGLAYQLLLDNVAGFEGDDAEAATALARLLEADWQATEQGEVPSLFSYFVAAPMQGAPGLGAILRRTVLEPARERFAELTGGVYPAELPRYAVDRLAAGVRRRLRR